jgi:hypothetical protein
MCITTPPSAGASAVMVGIQVIAFISPEVVLSMWDFLVLKSVTFNSFFRFIYFTVLY